MQNITSNTNITFRFTSEKLGLKTDTFNRENSCLTNEFSTGTLSALHASELQMMCAENVPVC
jgi:hypothetical protein